MACGTGTCGTYCAGSCTTACAQACNGSCKGSCSGCGNTCQRGCAVTCSPGCSGHCDGCAGTCTHTCADDCTGTCKDACNSGCTNESQVSIYTNLSLDEKFNQSNITDIANLIYNEANRRATNPTSLSFTVGEALTAAQITTIIENLNKTGHTTTYNAIKGEKGLRELGLDLIAKAKAAYDEEVV